MTSYKTSGMRFPLILFFGIISLGQLLASDTILTHIFRDHVVEQINFVDSLEFLVDTEAQLTIEDLLRISDSKFSSLEQEPIIKAPIVIWSKLQLTNAGLKNRDGYFKFFKYADSIWMYTVEDGKVVDQTFTGNVLQPFEKSLSSNQNYLPLNLYAGQTKSYYFKMQYNKIVCSNKCLSRLRYFPSDLLIKNDTTTYMAQSFYAGIMLLLALVSLFMYFMFVDRIFIYYSWLMVSFSAYFAAFYGLNQLLFNYHPTAFTGRTDLMVIVPSVILSFSFFINRYLDLPKRLPRFSKAYLAYALLAASALPAFQFFANDLANLGPISDVLTIPWIILSMGLVIWSAKKRDKASIILLLSIGVLFLGSLLFIVRLIVIFPPNLWMKHGFQIGTLFFSILLFYGLFDNINKIRAEKRWFEELDQMKSRFFTNISHEFRTPLTLLMGPIKQVAQKTSDPKDQKLLQLAYQNAERLLQLINQLLDLSKLEAGKMELKAKEQNFAKLLKGIVLSFQSLAARKNIQLHFVSQKEDIPLFVDKHKMEKIFFNLLSNAFKFTTENGEVSVMITEREKQVEILIRDNGIGIPAARLSNIFNRFFQVESKEISAQEGTGIGLALVKELIQLHQGKISVKSTLGEGTTFTILIPKGKAHLATKDIVDQQPILEKTNSLTNQYITPLLKPEPINEQANVISIKRADERPLVLVIEDNTDIRTYIKEHLNASFQILEAINGEDGIEKAFAHLPDLIISDVMMPKKDGYEVCSTLKSDQRTSHIPVILLTAKATPEEKIKGLEIKADDYLVKPFDTKELEVRVCNLIELRRQLRKQFAESNPFQPQTAGTNAVDKAFLEKVCMIVEKYLADEQFSVDFLAREVGLSRSHLNRKLKALTDQSTNKFIQSFRLQKAKEMLQWKTGNVSEVAMQTGFRSTAYFVKCFGDKYGKTPGSVLQE